MDSTPTVDLRKPSSVNFWMPTMVGNADTLKLEAIQQISFGLGDKKIVINGLAFD